MEIQTFLQGDYLAFQEQTQSLSDLILLLLTMMRYIEINCVIWILLLHRLCNWVNVRFFLKLLLYLQ